MDLTLEPMIRRLLPLTNTKYRDYRPTLQLSYALFYDQQAIEESVLGMTF